MRLESGIGAQGEGAPGYGFEAERSLRILAVFGVPGLLDPIARVLEKHAPIRFTLARVAAPDEVAQVLAAAPFDLLLFDLGGAMADRRARIDAADRLATQRPVVVLTGTEALAGLACEEHERRLASAGLPALLLRTLRRAERLGSMAVPPVFCRLDHPGA